MRNIIVGGFILVALNIASLVWGEDVAVIVSRNAGPYQTALQGFETQAKFTYKIFNMDGDTQKGNAIVQTISQSSYQAVVTIGTEASLIAKNLTADMPLIYSMVLTPLDSSKVNTSGVYIKIDVKNQLEIMRKIFPTKKRIGVIYNLQMTGSEISEARKVADKLDIKLSTIAVEEREEIPKALAKLTANAVDIIWMIADTTVGHPESVKEFITHSQHQNLPLFGFAITHVKAGALAAFSADYTDIGKQTALLTTQVKNGAVKNVLEGPRKIIVFVNPKIQNQLGISDLSVFSEVQFIQ